MNKITVFKCLALFTFIKITEYFHCEVKMKVIEIERKL